MILEYVKGFLTLFLLVKVLLYFIPKNVFSKYIAFFSGVILVIGLLYPLLQIMNQDEVILERLQYEDWEEQLLEISVEAERVEEEGKAFMEAQYEQEGIVIETVKIGVDAQAGDIDE